MGPLRSTAALVLAALLFSPSAYSSHHEFDCTAALAGSAQVKQQAIAQLLNATWDTAKLGCAARAVVAMADAHPEDKQAQLSALRTNAKYVYYLDRIVLYELGYLIVSYTTDVPQEKMINQSMIDLMAAQEEQLRLLMRAAESGYGDPEVQFFEALTKGPSADAQPMLEAVVKADPPGLDGAAHAMLGEILYALPDISGGDLDRAIELMREARERSPENPLYARLLAAWLLDIGADDESRSILAGLLDLEPATGELQLNADQLRIAGDIAGRIPDPGLVQQLASRRSAMLDEHPYLQSRKVVVALGHFGDTNPMEE